MLKFVSVFLIVVFVVEAFAGVLGSGAGTAQAWAHGAGLGTVICKLWILARNSHKIFQLV